MNAISIPMLPNASMVGSGPNCEDMFKFEPTWLSICCVSENSKNSLHSSWTEFLYLFAEKYERKCALSMTTSCTIMLAKYPIEVMISWILGSYEWDVRESCYCRLFGHQRLSEGCTIRAFLWCLQHSTHHSRRCPRFLARLVIYHLFSSASMYL